MGAQLSIETNNEKRNMDLSILTFNRSVLSKESKETEIEK